MLLTTLEIKGFKSFGEKVVFRFDKGVTAVVGPNGSGKSNVVDAIRWVLGEQSSRALRSDKMENVIFNGTKNRRPLQMAEVSMTFKNTKNLLPTEYTEVTISRRYYRSGDGEYLLNGVACRLKDIQSLFMDTGIGPDSYAIIELKMVDEILNDQNHSRRILFEEAAGISKFKKRKKETLKKLADTNADLERVDDLLFEIEKNMRSLERQARQVERYMKLKEEYKRLSIALARKSIGGKLDATKQLEKQLLAENEQKVLLDSEAAKMEAALEAAKNTLLQKEKLLAGRQKTLNEHVNKIRQFESEKKIKNERLKFLNERALSLQQQVEEDTRSSERAKFSLEGLLREKEQIDKLLKETTYQLEEFRKAFEGQKEKTQRLKEEANELEQQAQSRQNMVYQLNKNLEIGQVQLNSLRQELERESDDSESKSASMGEFDEKIGMLEEKLTVGKSQYEKLLSKKNELVQQIQSNEASLQSLLDQQVKTNRELDARQNEFNLTKSMLDNFEGYPQAIKFLKKNMQWGKDAPLLSDIITCDEKYRIAVENYLEPYLNYYILENQEQALEAVNLLSDAAKGKGNFLLVDQFEKYSPPSSRQFEDAVPAIDIVEYDEKYRHMVHFMLENVYIVTKNQESFPLDQGAIFITQNGKVIKRRYSISGGSVGLFEGKKIGRAKNLEKLTDTIKKLQAKAKEIGKYIAQRQQDLESLKADLPGDQLDELKEENTLLQQELATVKTRKEQFIELLRDKENRKEAITEKIAQLEQSIEESRPKLENESALLEEVKVRLIDVKEDVERETDSLSQHSANFNQQNLVFHQQTNKQESTDKEIGYKQNVFERGNARIANNKSELQHTEEEIGRLEEKSDDQEQLLIRMYEEKKVIEEGVTEAERDYYDMRGQISETEKSIRENQHKREGAATLIMEIKEQSNQLRMEMSGVRERMSVEFEVDIDKLIDEEDESVELEEGHLREEVEKVKQKMEKTGPVNHMAIEAYNEIKERYEFINTQRDDLLESIESLNTTIGEIDTVARENFMKAFGMIRENFVTVFRSLFTEEDSCDLILLDEEDPLNSKIEIIAQPKGKKPLTISQLSGGEKTLTATALLFAIYLLKPAPFCIFDEVDAPLDDANIDKFNNIIKKFSENSQFIVVTHNKRTMSSTDVIYGITMVEQGISTVVPVDLRALEDTPGLVE